MFRTAINFVHHVRDKDHATWRPLLGIHYITYRCSFRCPYCSDGGKRPYYALRETDLGAAGNLAILERVRRACSHVVLTGGEPLEHPEIDAILDRLPPLGFRSVVFTTNGLDLERYLPQVAAAVTDLVVSIDTLDEPKADRWSGAGPGTLVRIKEALARARDFPGRRYSICISAVVTPDNLDDLPDLYRWSQSCGFVFAASPELRGVYAAPGLREDARYRAFFELLIAGKRSGRPVYGTLASLEYMRDLRPFRCRPLTLLVTSPRGDVFYPCLERGTRAGNILDEPDVDALLAAGRRLHGPLPECDTRCHSCCALGFATILDRPLGLVAEAWLQARARYALWRGTGPIMRA